MLQIAIVNYKGGVGKTTTSVNLAYGLSSRGWRVCVLDLDERAQTTTHYGLEKDPEGLYEVLINKKGNLADLVTPTEFGVDVIRGGDMMADFDRSIGAKHRTGGEYLLSERLDELPKDRWDIILIDCPGTVGSLNMNALVAARTFIIPVFPGEPNIEGIEPLIQDFQIVRKRPNPKLFLLGVVALQVEGRTRVAKATRSKLEEVFKDFLFRTMIRKNVKVTEAYSKGKPLALFDSSCPAAKDFEALADEVEQKLASHNLIVAEEQEEQVAEVAHG